MALSGAPIRSWLYAPGNNARLLQRVFEAGADGVILDLEDAVPVAEKARARSMVAEVVRARASASHAESDSVGGQVAGPTLFVRINHPESGLAQADIDAVVGPGLAGLRLPKTEDAQTVQRVADWVRRSGGTCRPGGWRAAADVRLETARGVWRAGEIAAAPRVLSLVFGAIDFGRDVGAEPGPDGLETLYARSQLVLASRVAGIAQPVDSVYPRLQDDEGLARSTRQARALGFFGRSALHPRQVPIINAAFTPTDAEVARAREIVAAAAAAERTGSGAVQLADGEFIDAPVLRRAEAILHLAQALERVYE